MSPRIVALASAAAAGAAMFATAALGQAPGAPVGNYGGGAVPAPPKDPYGVGAMTISLRATGDGKVQIRAGLGATCGSATIHARATVAADGTFSASGTAKERLSGRRHLRTKYTIQGSITDAHATGAASVSNKVTTGARSRTCKSGPVSWSAVRATGAIGTPGAPVASALMYGNTAQRYGSLRGAIVLRISPDGKRLTRALYDAQLRCGTRTVSGGVDTPSRNLAIGAGGQVKDVELFGGVMDKRTRVRTVEHFNGTIGSAGASGRFSFRSTYRDRRTGRKVGGCQSGSVKWTASL